MWDPDGQRLVLFGGYGNLDRTLLDTWTWDGTDWHQQASLNPGAFTNVQSETIAYDGNRHRLVLFIELRANDKSPGPNFWSLTGLGDWQPETAAGPPMGIQPQMVWDAARGDVMLLDPIGAGRPVQTWVWGRRRLEPAHARGHLNSHTSGACAVAKSLASA